MDLQRLRSLLLEALKEVELAILEEDTSEAPGELVWGKKVSDTFKDRVRWIAQELDFDPNWIMACMAFESAETFSSSIKNAAGSGAVGLIQFMPSTAKGLGTTPVTLASMTPEDQLKFVYKYFEPYRGRLNSLEDLYMAILWPKAVGKPLDYQLFIKGGVTYRQNAGLDRDKDGVITKAEAANKVREKFEKGKKYLG